MGLSFSTKSGLSHEELKQLQVDTDLSKSNLRRLKNRFDSHIFDGLKIN